ncbi:MAG: DUF2155 domain-containing protein [Geminicoccaceae bacterium]
MFRLALLLFAMLPFGQAMAVSDIPNEIVVVQTLDKITARIGEQRVRVGEEARFGTLLFKASVCFETPPTEPPESSVFIQIDEETQDEPRRRLFNGWMFASSPALSALEHPVYDIWIIDCEEPLEQAG